MDSGPRRPAMQSGIASGHTGFGPRIGKRPKSLSGYLRVLADISAYLRLFAGRGEISGRGQGEALTQWAGIIFTTGDGAALHRLLGGEALRQQRPTGRAIRLSSAFHAFLRFAIGGKEKREAGSRGFQREYVAPAVLGGFLVPVSTHMPHLRCWKKRQSRASSLLAWYASVRLRTPTHAWRTGASGELADRFGYRRAVRLYSA